MSSRISQVKVILGSKFKHLFKNPEKIEVKKSNESIFVPDEGLTRTVPLKDGVGAISICEKIKNDNVVFYIYRFESHQYNCLTGKINSEETSECENFYFHYDKCENDEPHPPHLTVIYPDIRYISKHISLEDFLLQIQNTFFIPDSLGRMMAKKDCLWFSKMSK